MNSRNKKLLPFFIMVLGAVLMMATLFMPFAKADKEHKKNLTKYADGMYIEEINMKNKDAVNISLIEYFKVYKEALNQNMQRETSIACIVIISVFGLFALLCLLFAILKKQIGAIIMSLLASIAMLLIRYDFSDRGIIPSSTYEWGISAYSGFVATVIIVIGSIIMITLKNKTKKLECE